MLTTSVPSQRSTTRPIHSQFLLFGGYVSVPFTLIIVLISLQVVDLQCLTDIFAYMSNVPESYHRYTRQLSICTSPTKGGACPGSTGHTDSAISQALSRLLATSTQIEHLSLRLDGSLDKSLISLFQNLDQLKTLSIHHCGDEQQTPL